MQFSILDDIDEIEKTRMETKNEFTFKSISKISESNQDNNDYQYGNHRIKKSHGLLDSYIPAWEWGILMLNELVMRLEEYY